MTSKELYALMDGLKKQGIVCYAYRETAFEMLSYGASGGTVNLLTDCEMNRLKDALKKCGFGDSTVTGQMVHTEYAGQKVDIRVIVSMTREDLIKFVRHPLSIHSLLLRSNGNVLDFHEGLRDLKEKMLRMTGAPVRDKKGFCQNCINLTLLSGFTAYDNVKDEMKKAITFPPDTKLLLVADVKKAILGGSFDIRSLLHVVEYGGLFSALSQVSFAKEKKLDAFFRRLNALQLEMLLHYLIGIKKDQLKEQGISREEYEYVCNSAKSDLSDSKRYQTVKNKCRAEVLEVLLAINEFNSLIAGEEFSLPGSPVSDLFRDLDESDLWKSVGEEASPLPAVETEGISDEAAEEELSDVPGDFEGFGGITEDGYEVVDADDEDELPYIHLPVRDPGANFYVKHK